MTKICSIKEKSPGRKIMDLGYWKVAISSDAIQIDGDEMVRISFKDITNYAESMASEGTKEDNFEGLMFRIDLNDGRKMVFEYTYDQDEKSESEAYEEIFDRFVAPLRRHFMKEIFEKKISDLTEHDLEKLYDTFRRRADYRKALMFLFGMFLFGVTGMLWFMYPTYWLIILAGGIVAIVMSWHLTVLFAATWEVSSRGFRYTSKFRSVLVPWDHVFKFTKTEKRTGKGGSFVNFFYSLHYREGEKEKKISLFDDSMEAGNFQRILRVCRAKLKNIPQLKSRGYNVWIGTVGGYVDWPLD